MNIIKITENEWTFTFVCDYHNTHAGFAHDCNLFIDTLNNHSVFMTSAHCYYYNRTWECWTYQTVCITAINNLIHERIDILKRDFLRDHGYKILTKKRAPEFNILLEKDITLKAYNACKNDLQTKKYY